MMLEDGVEVLFVRVDELSDTISTSKSCNVGGTSVVLISVVEFSATVSCKVELFIELVAVRDCSLLFDCEENCF